MPGESGLELLKRIKRNDERLPVVMMTAHGDVDGAVDAMKAGASDFLTKPLDYIVLRALIETLADEARQRQQSRSLDRRLSRQDGATGLVGQSRSMRELERVIEVLASSDASAIITGESGTGKEVVARTVHALSSRRDKPFIAINAAAIPEGLIESEVFGHEQGAFTGATKPRAGVFELADGGTLFLDEIAEMPISLQPKAAPHSRGRAREAVGRKQGAQLRRSRSRGDESQSPAQAIRDGQLREDLFYRLNVFEIKLPPLRERADDIPLLAQHFVREFDRKHHLEVEGVGDAARELLERAPVAGKRARAAQRDRTRGHRGALRLDRAAASAAVPADAAGRRSADAHAAGGHDARRGGAAAHRPNAWSGSGTTRPRRRASSGSTSRPSATSCAATGATNERRHQTARCVRAVHRAARGVARVSRAHGAAHRRQRTRPRGDLRAT